MSVPKFNEFMLPVLRQLSDGQPRHWRELREGCIAEFGLTEEALVEETAGGKSRVDDRVLWSTTYLFQAGLVERPSRGVVQINDRGRELLKGPPEVITPVYLRRYPEFVDFMTRTRSRDQLIRDDTPESPAEQTPVDTIAAAEEEWTAAVRGELLLLVIAQPPDFLERLVLELLTAMGYGARRGDVQHRGGPGDGGIDGVIRQDPLGLDRVYVQAKRYTEQAVGRQDIQAFVGALHGVQADRGVFITTSSFTSNARDYVERIPNRIILIDGPRLTELMVRYDVGVQAEQTFTLKRIDEDFFE